MEARLDALKAKFRKYAAPVLTTFALSGGMAAPTQAGGVSDVLDGVVDEIKTQTEQVLRGTVQRSKKWSYFFGQVSGKVKLHLVG